MMLKLSFQGYMELMERWHAQSLTVPVTNSRANIAGGAPGVAALRRRREEPAAGRAFQA
jgi:hypothetical protein